MGSKSTMPPGYTEKHDNEDVDCGVCKHVRSKEKKKGGHKYKCIKHKVKVLEISTCSDFKYFDD